MKRIKILTISTSGLAKKEGISTVILDNYALFDKDKFQLDVIASGNYNYQLVTEFQNIGVNIKCLPSRKINVIDYIIALMKLMKKEKYDAIYLHGSSAIMSIELIVAKMCGCRIRVVHSHNTTCDHKIVDKLLRPIFYRSYTVALACGSEAGEWLYRGHSFDIIKNGRNTSVYAFNENKRVHIREKLGLQDKVFAIGHVGNFNAQKNQRFLISIMEQIVKENENIRLYLMGDGKTRDELMETVKAKKLEKNICFTGSILNVPDMLQAMDLMLLPSLHEGLPLVAIEWQMMGLPCILSDRITKECAFTDLVEFLPIVNTKDWINIILKEKNNKNDRERASIKAISAAKAKGYDLSTNAEKLQRYFENGDSCE